eukprot:Pgem_evm1s8985
MFESGVGESVFLPDHNRLDKLSFCSQYSHNPVTLLVSLLNDFDEFESISNKWRFSNMERNIGVHIVEHRDTLQNLIDNNNDKEKCDNVCFKFVTDQLVDGFVPLDTINELLLYVGLVDVSKRLLEFRAPKFPVNGKDVILAGVKKGPPVGEAILKLKTLWKNSYYTLTKEELLKEI